MEGKMKQYQEKTIKISHYFSIWRYVVKFCIL